MPFAIALFIIAVIFVARTFRVVPQQEAWIVQRMGRFHSVLQPGLNLVIPFVDAVAYKHTLKEIPLDVPSQVCITRDNTQLTVDGILYFQVTDPKLASYGSSNYVMAISQLAQTTLRSVIGKLELDRTFEERDDINRAVVLALDEAATSWGVKVLRYEIKDLTPPKEILHAMQQQITAEREKRGRIAQSEGVRQEQINLSEGQRTAAIQKSEGDMRAQINQSEGERQARINRAQGEAEALRLVAAATADAVRAVGDAVRAPGGLEAMNLKVAEQYIAAFANIAKQGNTILLPANAGDVASLVATATTIIGKKP
ncbi:stomatin-like protein [Silvimonas sp. JCM 19000]